MRKTFAALASIRPRQKTTRPKTKTHNATARASLPLSQTTMSNSLRVRPTAGPAHRPLSDFRRRHEGDEYRSDDDALQR